MKRIRVLTTLGAAICLVQGSAFAHGPGSRNIEGLWKVEVTLRDCATGAVAPVPNPIFPTLNTFHAGGTESEHGSRFSPALRGSGQGIWKRTGARTYVLRTMFQTFDVNGFLTGDQDIRSTITLSNDGNSSTYTTNVTVNRIGLPPILGCATSVGQRVEL
jgi:hypothetical protein